MLLTHLVLNLNYAPTPNGFANFSRISSISITANRQKVPPHLERDTTSLTLRVAVAERFHTTSKRRHVPHVVTRIKRWGTSIGAKRPRVAVQSELVAWDTWKRFPADLRMDSERELKQRKWPRHRSLKFIFKQNVSSSFYRTSAIDLILNYVRIENNLLIFLRSKDIIVILKFETWMTV